MKKGIIAVLGGALLALVSVSGFAQDGNVVKVYVPFAFSVNESALPAGDYTLSQLSQNTWVVRNDDSRKGIAAMARPDGTNSEPSAGKLVFSKYGDHYLLSRVWCNGLITAVAEPKVERNIQIQMTGSNEKPETVYVLARAR